MSTRFFWLLALGLLISPAVSSAQPATGTVAGRVTFRGKPLVEGTVTFITRVAKTTGKIHPDGSYRVSGVPVGPAFIRVESRGLKVPPADTPAKSMPLPFTVRPGPQQHDIDLK
jgi:hypothetical protein